MEEKRILVVTHELSRTGAPIVLRDLLRQLSEEFEVWILSPEDGPLRDDFEQLGQVTILPPEGVEGSILRRLKYAGIPIRFKKFLNMLRAWKPQGIYYNSAASLPYVSQLAPLGLPVLVHLHEMETSLLRWVKSYQESLRGADRIVAVSEAVKNSLLSLFEFKDSTVRVIPNFIVVSPLLPSDTRSGFVVGGCGAPGWIKGSSLFVQVAAEVTALLPDAKIQFKWLGWKDTADGQQMRDEVRKMDLEAIIELLPPRPDPQNFFKTLSVFALTSWQDSFPLVVLENMSQGNPVLCFENSGGATDAVAGCTEPLKRFSALKMAESIIHYYQFPEDRKRDGDKCRQRALDVYNPDVIVPQFRDELNALIEGRKP